MGATGQLASKIGEVRAAPRISRGTVREQWSFAMNTTTNRLVNIATRQRRTRVRDAAFAALVLLAGIVSITSVSAAVHAASAAHVAKR